MFLSSAFLAWFWGCQECGWGFLYLPSSSFLLEGDFQMLFCFLKFVSKNSWRKESNVKRLVLRLYLLAPKLTSWKDLKNMSPSMLMDFTWKLSCLFYIKTSRGAWDTSILPSGRSFTDQEEPCNTPSPGHCVLHSSARGQGYLLFARGVCAAVLTEQSFGWFVRKIMNMNYCVTRACQLKFGLDSKVLLSRTVSKLNNGNISIT